MERTSAEEHDRGPDAVPVAGPPDAIAHGRGAQTLLDELDRRLASAPRARNATAVAMLIDVDDFTVVNHAYGHRAGDEVMRHAEHVLRLAVHADDLVVRFSADSFFVCCFHGLGRDRACGYADRLRAAMGQRRTLGDHDIHLRASAGVVVEGAARVSSDELLQKADAALTRAKDAGKNTSWLYDDGLRQQLLRRLDLEALVRRTVLIGHVSLAYQPIVRLEDETIVGAEALLRVVGDDGEVVPAGELVEAAERTGSIVGLGLLVLQAACKEAARWGRALPGCPLTIAVNLSASQLAEEHLPDLVATVLRATKLEPSLLCLEITESVLMEDSARSIRDLARLKALGVRLSMDDFGTGYSSLAYLKRLPLEAMKIDRSFVAGLPDSPEDASIVAAIMGVARGIGLDVVAEGIEDQAQLAALRRLGCGYGQGHLWARAVPGDELLALVCGAAHHPRPGDPATSARG
ncbi:MAG: diguanylate cyclase/phosphodiesterase with sensor(s) [Acidimicrobiales bacterium]|nr:diguanylate cyclase/phosphodiesterase with sensor(s) [Acidimicrobiales bacterium]